MADLKSRSSVAVSASAISSSTVCGRLLEGRVTGAGSASKVGKASTIGVGAGSMAIPALTAKIVSSAVAAWPELTSTVVLGLVASIVMLGSDAITLLSLMGVTSASSVISIAGASAMASTASISEMIWVLPSVMAVSLPPESSSDSTTWLASASAVAGLASVSMAFLSAWALASLAFISSCDSRQRTSSWRACSHWLASTAPGNCVSSCAIVASASAQLFWRRLISSRPKSAVSAFGSSLSAAIFNQDSAWGRLPTLRKS